MITAVIGITATLFGQSGRPIIDESRLILTKDAAYYLLPPILITEAASPVHIWSPNGRYVIGSFGGPLLLPPYPNDRSKIEQRKPKLILFDTQTGTSKELWKTDNPNTYPNLQCWKFDSTEAYFVTNTKVQIEGKPTDYFQEVLRISVPSGITTVVRSGAPSHTTYGINSSKNNSFTFLTESIPSESLGERQKINRVYSIDISGRLTLITESISDSIPMTGWLETGEPAISISEMVNGQFKSSIFVVTPQGLVEKSDNLAFASDLRRFQATDLVLRYAAGEVKNPRNEHMNTQIWLESKFVSERPRILVSIDGELPSLSPSLNGICYKTQGCLFFAPLVKLDKETYAKYLENFAAITDQRDCQQILYAILNWESKNGSWPEGDLMSTLGNQEISASAFAKFVYTKPSVSRSAMSDPGKIQLGYIQGRNGRVVAYANGSIELIPNPLIRTMD